MSDEVSEEERNSGPLLCARCGACLNPEKAKRVGGRWFGGSCASVARSLGKQGLTIRLRDGTTFRGAIEGGDDGK